MPSEVELAKRVVAYFEHDGWDVYQEVGCGSCTADLVIIREPVIGVVECKTSFGLAVIAQAHHWKRYAHVSYVAVPGAFKRSGGRGLGQMICKEKGIGIIHVNKWEVKQLLAPRLTRRIYKRIKVREEHKTWAPAGTNGGGRWTPFRNTVKEMEQYVLRHPGCTMKEMMKGIDHHYSSDSSARSSLSMYMREGIITCVEAKQEGKELKLYPARSDNG
jgi:hypothetical protein